MKDIGIIRKASQGRIVFPIEMRRALSWDDETELEIFSDGSGVFVQKYEPACVFCGSDKDVLYFETKRICKNCLKKLQKQTCPTA